MEVSVSGSLAIRHRSQGWWDRASAGAVPEGYCTARQDANLTNEPNLTETYLIMRIRVTTSGLLAPSRERTQCRCRLLLGSPGCDDEKDRDERLGKLRIGNRAIDRSSRK
jgi:hypothetical protein